MKKNESVTKIMSKDPISVTTVTPLQEVAAIFAEHGIHHVPVVDGKQLKGLITYSDLMRLSFADAFQQDRQQVMEYLDDTKKITEIMITEIKSIPSTGNVKEAAQMLCQGDFHSACVVNKAGELEGIVTSTDVIKYLLDQY